MRYALTDSAWTIEARDESIGSGCVVLSPNPCKVPGYAISSSLARIFSALAASTSGSSISDRWGLSF